MDVQLTFEVNISVPKIILENNQALRPDHLQDLFDYLRDESDLEPLIPIFPYQSGAKERMEEIFKIIIKCFDWQISSKYMNWISYLAYRWVWGEPIGKILAERVSYMRETKPDQDISPVIRNCLSVLENSIRFKLVKYFSAYIEILRQVLIDREQTELLSEIEPYHIYLEFGSCNKHALNLMALGMSRFTALHLEGKFDFESEDSEVYLAKLRQMNIASLTMPEICKKEMRDIVG
jgi:hypothetical protein